MGFKRLGRGFELDEARTRYRNFQRTIPRVIANNSKNHFVEGFRKGGGQTDDSKEGWTPRRGGRRNARRGVLVDTGALWRSIRVLQATFSKIVIGTTRVRYAEKHNEGLEGMPKREFIGDSEDLNKKNKEILIKELDKVFK